MTTATPNFLENFALSRSFALGKNFSLAAKKEISHLTPNPILRASESLATAFLQTLGVILLFFLLLQPLEPWPSRPSFQNHTWEQTFPSATSHLEKTTYAYDAASGSSLYCNGDPVNGLDPDGRCVEGYNAGWANGNGSFAGTYDSSQASSEIGYGAGWLVGGALGDVNVMVARPVAALTYGAAELIDSGINATEQAIGLPSGSIVAASFAFGPEVGLPMTGLRALGSVVRSGNTVAEATGEFYSVAFETKLSSTSYPGATRYMHFKEANTALDAAVEADPTFGKLGISIPKTSTGSILGKSPENWVWHHDSEPGVMQLVPKNQHPNIPGGIFWETMHPGGDGGYSIWGK
ncbi:MAG: hypothetical protein FJ390_07885 [Verrucomicrobia bacterium]|nr:hypothetical protein [Verrucomicrobiota bacterium]